MSNELSMITEYMTSMMEAIGTFLSSGVMFYIMCILMLAVIIELLISFIK